MSASYNELIEKGILLAPDVLDSDVDFIHNQEFNQDQLIINKDILDALRESKSIQSNWLEFEKALFLKDKKNDDKFYQKFIFYLKNFPDAAPSTPSGIKTVFNYAEKSIKRTAADFTSYFNQRYKVVEKMLKSRAELQGLTSISRLRGKKERETGSIIGMVLDKQTTKNQNIILTVEDQTGTIKVLISQNREDLKVLTAELVLDEIIGITGTMGKDLLYANAVIFPDVPMDKELKKAKEEVYAAFLGDFHYGSKYFLKKEFDRFLAWIKSDSGSEEQKRIAAKTKYLFILGDMVEGVGIYPGQEEDLEITDIKQQYNEVAELIKQIPSEKQVVIIPGNHDAGRISEPQLALDSDFSNALTKIPNVMLLSNPAILNIESSDDFSGFNVLLYHGYSLIYYADNVESIRAKGGQKRADLIMQLLLRKRHLAPTHTSNLYIPDSKKDPLVIEQIPDIFATGHIHRVAVKNYRNITLLNCSCWSSITEDQEKRGLEPQPGRVLLVNLQTREVKVMNFLDKEK